MATHPIDITTIRFEAKDAEIFNIPDTKTRLVAPQLIVVPAPSLDEAFARL